MAENQPAPTPAPEPVVPQVPAPEPATPPADPKPADPVVTPAPVALSDDQKAYLKGQGLKDEDLNSPDALAKIINHAQSSQKTAAEIKAQLDKIKGTINPEEPAPTNPLLPTATPNPTDAPAKGIDPVTAYTLSSNLANNFPELKEDLLSGKFYTDMQALGISLLDNNGGVNLNGILKYGEAVQKNRQLEAKIAEFDKPGSIPDARPSETKIAEDAPMTKQIAQNIVMFAAAGNTHPRAEEAKTFLQKSV